LLITRTRLRRRGKNKKQSAPTLEPSGPSGATHFASLSHIPDSPTFRRAVPRTHLLHLRHLLTTQGPASASQRWQCKLTDSHETRKDTTVLHSIWQSGTAVKRERKKKEKKRGILNRGMVVIHWASGARMADGCAGTPLNITSPFRPVRLCSLFTGGSPTPNPSPFPIPIQIHPTPLVNLNLYYKKQKILSGPHHSHSHRPRPSLAGSLAGCCKFRGQKAVIPPCM